MLLAWDWQIYLDLIIKEFFSVETLRMKPRLVPSSLILSSKWGTSRKGILSHHNYESGDVCDHPRKLQKASDLKRNGKSSTVGEHFDLPYQS